MRNQNRIALYSLDCSGISLDAANGSGWNTRQSFDIPAGFYRMHQLWN